MNSLTPCQIVAELDKYIIGQEQAKRMVAVAVRNRWAKQKSPDASPGSPERPSSRWKPPNILKSAMWAAMWNP